MRPLTFAILAKSVYVVGMFSLQLERALGSKTDGCMISDNNNYGYKVNNKIEKNVFYRSSEIIYMLMGN